MTLVEVSQHAYNCLFIRTIVLFVFLRNSCEPDMVLVYFCWINSVWVWVWVLNKIPAYKDEAENARVVNTRSPQTEDARDMSDVPQIVDLTGTTTHISSVSDSSPAGARQNETDQSFQVISDITVDVVTPSQVPPGAEMIVQADINTNEVPCPPSLALDAIESTLTPRKRSRYNKRFVEGVDVKNDPVFSTWKYLKQQVCGQVECNIIPSEEHPLVTSGLIPKRLADVFQIPPQPCEEDRTRLGRKHAIVPTSEEIRSAFHEKEEQKRKREAQKNERMERKSKRMKKCSDSPKENSKLKQKSTKSGLKTGGKRKRKQSPNKPWRNHSSIDTSLAHTSERYRHFSHVQAVLSSCKSFSAMQSVCPENFPYPMPEFTSRTCQMSSTTHAPSDALLEKAFHTFTLKSVDITADGNCLPRTISVITSGTQDSHVEMRVRMVAELLHHRDYYPGQRKT